MNRKYRRELFKRFQKVHPGARSTRCFTEFFYHITDSGDGCISAFDVAKAEKIKVFMIGGYDYIAARNIHEAFREYADMVGGTEEAEELYLLNEYHEVADSALDIMTVLEEPCEDEDGNEMDQDERTFRQEIMRHLFEGTPFPLVLASTEG